MKSAEMHQVEHVQRMAEEYASYSASKSGLGNVLGGGVGIAIYLINGLLGRNLWTTIFTLSLTLIWFVGKELLRARLYRPFGSAQEIVGPQTRKLRPWILSLSTIAALVICVLIWLAFLKQSLNIGPIRLILAFVCAASIPLLCWRYLHTLDEFLIGFFLLICCAVTSLGSAMVFPGIEGWLGMLWVPFYALILIMRGLSEHSTFRQLARQFQEGNEQQ